MSSCDGLAARYQRRLQAQDATAGAQGREVLGQPALGSLFISEVTLAEIRFGIERLSSPTRRAEIKDWLTHKLRPMFERRVLAISEDVILKWRLIVEEGRKAGHTFPQPDLFIAATALHHGLTVVTRDTADHGMAGVPVYSPWTAPAPSE